jgi:hypothetical protein
VVMFLGRCCVGESVRYWRARSARARMGIASDAVAGRREQLVTGGGWVPTGKDEQKMHEIENRGNLYRNRNTGSR